MPTTSTPGHAPERPGPAPERPGPHERPGLSWSGTVDYGPGPLHAPTSLDQLQELVAASDRVRALGTRH